VTDADELKRAIDLAEWNVGFVSFLMDQHRQLSMTTPDSVVENPDLLRRLARAKDELAELQAAARHPWFHTVPASLDDVSCGSPATPSALSY
jgi:hypothetical protein